MHVGDPVLVDVAADEHGVARLLRGEVGQQPGAGGGVAVPRVHREAPADAMGIVARREHGLLRHEVPAGRPARRIAQRLPKRPLLRLSQQAARIHRGTGADARVAGCLLVAAQRRIAVLPVVQQVQACQPAEVDVTVDAQLGAGPQAPQPGGQGGGPQRHVFVERLVAGGAARGELRRPGGGQQAAVVVLDLVVVPDHQPWTGCVHALQVGIAAIERVARAEVVQGADRRQRVRSHRAPAGGLIDVVAEEQHQVGLLAEHVPVRRVMAHLPALAGRVGEAQPVHDGIGCGKRARAALRTDGVAGHQAVAVPAVRPQSGDFHVDRVRKLRHGERRAGRDDRARGAVLEHLPADGHRRCRIQPVIEQARPEHEAVGRGGAAGHTQPVRVRAEARGRGRCAGGGAEDAEPCQCAKQGAAAWIGCCAAHGGTLPWTRAAAPALARLSAAVRGSSGRRSPPSPDSPG